MYKTDILQLIHTLQLFTNHATVKWNRAFEGDLGISSLLVLATLESEGQQRQTELAHILGLTPGAITNISDKLIKKGYAQRKFDDHDRRVIYLAITEEGKKIIKLARAKGEQVQTEIFQVLNESEYEQLLKIYKKLLSQF